MRRYGPAHANVHIKLLTAVKALKARLHRPCEASVTAAPLNLQHKHLKLCRHFSGSGVMIDRDYFLSFLKVNPA